MNVRFHLSMAKRIQDMFHPHLGAVKCFMVILIWDRDLKNTLKLSMKLSWILHLRAQLKSRLVTKCIPLINLPLILTLFTKLQQISTSKTIVRYLSDIIKMLKIHTRRSSITGKRLVKWSLVLYTEITNKI